MIFQIINKFLIFKEKEIEKIILLSILDKTSN